MITREKLTEHKDGIVTSFIGVKQMKNEESKTPVNDDSF